MGNYFNCLGLDNYFYLAFLSGFEEKGFVEGSQEPDGKRQVHKQSVLKLERFLKFQNYAAQKSAKICAICGRKKREICPRISQIFAECFSIIFLTL